MNKQLRFFTDLNELSYFTAEYILQKAKTLALQNGIFTIAVSGGTTPKKLFSILAGEHYQKTFPWEKTHIFWVDERYVPESDDDNNYKAAKELLISKTPLLKPNHIHRIDTSLASPEEAAARYDHELKTFFNHKLPSFNIVLLGMGEDGHTASLFPDTEVLHENSKWIASTPAPTEINPKVPRVTLTYPVLNNSEIVLFLIGGTKRKELAEMFMDSDNIDTLKYPAAGVKNKGSLLWLTSLT